MKCIDQMPRPMAAAPPASHQRATRLSAVAGAGHVQCSVRSKNGHQQGDDDQALTVAASHDESSGGGRGARKAHARDPYRRRWAGLEWSQHLRPGSAILPRLFRCWKSSDGKSPHRLRLQ